MPSKVELFLDTYKAFVEGAKERGLESTMTADTIQKSVVSVFIADNQNGGTGHTQTEPGATGQAKRGNSQSQASGAAVQNLSGTIEKKRKEAKTSRQGKPYTQYSLLVNGKWYNTLNGKVFEGKVINEGDFINFTVEQNDGGYWNLTSVELAPDDQEEDPIDIPF